MGGGVVTSFKGIEDVIQDGGQILYCFPSLDGLFVFFAGLLRFPRWSPWRTVWCRCAALRQVWVVEGPSCPSLQSL